MKLNPKPNNWIKIIIILMAMWEVFFCSSEWSLFMVFYVNTECTETSKRKKGNQAVAVLCVDKFCECFFSFSLTLFLCLSTIHDLFIVGRHFSVDFNNSKFHLLTWSTTVRSVKSPLSLYLSVCQAKVKTTYAYFENSFTHRSNDNDDDDDTSQRVNETDIQKKYQRERRVRQIIV